jgi:hypothetical protein
VGHPFTYRGIKLQFVGEQSSVLTQANGIQDSPIRFGVVAKVIE